MSETVDNSVDRKRRLHMRFALLFIGILGIGLLWYLSLPGEIPKELKALNPVTVQPEKIVEKEKTPEQNLEPHPESHQESVKESTPPAQPETKKEKDSSTPEKGKVDKGKKIIGQGAGIIKKKSPDHVAGLHKKGQKTDNRDISDIPPHLPPLASTEDKMRETEERKRAEDIERVKEANSIYFEILRGRR